MKKETLEAEPGHGSANELSPLLAGCPNELKASAEKARKILAELAR